MLENTDILKIMPMVSALLFIIACIVGFVFRAKEFNQSRFSVFIQMLAPIGVVMVGISIYTDTAQFELDKQNQKLSIYKDRVEKLFIIPIEKTFQTPNIRPIYYSSFFPANPVLYELGQKDQTPVTAASEVAEYYVSIQILQVYEDYLNYLNVDDFEDENWLAVFIKWSTSHHLQKHAAMLKSNYSDTTISFFELSTKYGENIALPVTDPNIFLEAGRAMMKDPKLAKIHKKVKESKF